MASVLAMPKVKLNGFTFRLLWNGAAMNEWNTMPEGQKELTTDDLTGIADMLWIMGREASAACKVYGYTPDNVPEREALREYFAHVALPYELTDSIEAINTALLCGSKRDYDPTNGAVDVDMIELKKN